MIKSESIPSHTEQSTQCGMVQSMEPIRAAETRRATPNGSTMSLNTAAFSQCAGAETWASERE